MRSHTYNYAGRQILYAVAPTLAVFLGCMVTLHLADWAGWLPPRSDDPELQHQARMAGSHHPAQIVVVGDSTCLCGIDATALSNELPGHLPVINLSLYIWYDLGTYGQVTADFAAANPGQVKWVVLLLSGGKLSGETEDTNHAAIWEQLKNDYGSQGDRHRNFWEQGKFFDGQLLHERLARNVLPEALHGRGAMFFGFMSDIDPFMTAHNGGLFDFGEYVPPSNPSTNRWTVASKFAPACRDFRKKMAPGVKLAIGLTPVVLASTPSGAREQYLACLQQWNGWMHADLVLSNLPATLPPMYFAPGGHMNARGQKMFTSAVAKELSPALR